MPPRDPSKVQLDFPLLIADLIRQLNLTGTLGVLDFSTEVVPVFIVGDRDLTVDAAPPVFTAAQILHTSTLNPTAGALILNGGPLPAGTYDIFANVSFAGSLTAFALGIRLEHRNAADDTTIEELMELVPGTSLSTGSMNYSVKGHVFAENERLRWVNAASNVAGQVAVTIGTAIRPIP